MNRNTTFFAFAAKCGRGAAVSAPRARRASPPSSEASAAIPNPETQSPSIRRRE
jgi:hypothetical protein